VRETHEISSPSCKTHDGAAEIASWHCSAAANAVSGAICTNSGGTVSLSSRQRAHLGGGQIIERRLDEVREMVRQVPVARPLHHQQRRPVSERPRPA